MPHAFGYRARTPTVFAKKFRHHGPPAVTRYITVIKTGDYVDIVGDPGIQKGLPHKHYQGKTGRVWNVSPRGIGIMVNKQVNQRIIVKRVCVRSEHVRLSRCQEEFKKRVAYNEAAKKAVSAILDQFGWETADMGKAEAARAIEPLCMLWCIPGFVRNQWTHAFKLLTK